MVEGLFFWDWSKRVLGTTWQRQNGHGAKSFRKQGGRGGRDVKDGAKTTFRIGDGLPNHDGQHLPGLWGQSGVAKGVGGKKDKSFGAKLI